MDLNAVENVLYLSDSYKISHHRQYPPKTEYVYSYFESRGGKFEQVCFFGLQYIIKRWLTGKVVDKNMVKEASKYYAVHFGGNSIFNEEGWNYICEKHDGHLPLRIKAVPEGTVLPTKNVLFTVENTDPQVPWLTNWFETLLVQVWYPMTVATSSREQKVLITKYMQQTSDNLDDIGIGFKLHDFGYRGSTSVESAAIGAAAHLVNFCGSDTIAGLRLCTKYYNCPMAGFSIPAAEHSTITTWGRSGEAEAFKNMLTQFPVGPVAVVSDSYDLFNAISNVWAGGDLKSMVVSRGRIGKDNNMIGSLVIRPDSGDPTQIVLQILDLLSDENTFGCTTNSKGYKLLPPYLRIIQGDGICYDSIETILSAMKTKGYCADNIVFGSGGGLLQKVNRDTLKCAYKCSSVTIDGKQSVVFKDPVTDPGKKSKKGRLTLQIENGNYVTKQEGTGNPDKDLLVPVFENGKLLKEYNLEEIRKRAEVDALKK